MRVVTWLQRHQWRYFGNIHLWKKWIKFKGELMSNYYSATASLKGHNIKQPSFNTTTLKPSRSGYFYLLLKALPQPRPIEGTMVSRMLVSLQASVFHSTDHLDRWWILVRSLLDLLPDQSISANGRNCFGRWSPGTKLRGNGKGINYGYETKDWTCMHACMHHLH